MASGLLPCSSVQAVAGQLGSYWMRQHAGQQRWFEWQLLLPAWLHSDKKRKWLFMLDTNLEPL